MFRLMEVRKYRRDDRLRAWVALTHLDDERSLFPVVCLRLLSCIRDLGIYLRRVRVV